MLIVDILVDSKWNLSNHTCWLQCVMCLFQATLHASSCTAALMLVFVVKLAHVDQAPVLRMRGWVGSTFNLHRAGSYCTFSTLVKVYPHKTFFTRGSKKALQKPVLRGEWSRGGRSSSSIHLENRTGYLTPTVFDHYKQNCWCRVWNEKHVGIPGLA